MIQVRRPLKTIRTSLLLSFLAIANAAAFSAGMDTYLGLCVNKPTPAGVKISYKFQKVADQCMDQSLPQDPGEISFDPTETGVKCLKPEAYTAVSLSGNCFTDRSFIKFSITSQYHPNGQDLPVNPSVYFRVQYKQMRTSLNTLYSVELDSFDERNGPFYICPGSDLKCEKKANMPNYPTGGLSYLYAVYKN